MGIQDSAQRCQSHWLCSQVPRAMPCMLWTPSKHKLTGCSGAQIMSARLFICAQKYKDRWRRGQRGGNGFTRRPQLVLHQHACQAERLLTSEKIKGSARTLYEWQVCLKKKRFGQILFFSHQRKDELTGFHKKKRKEKKHFPSDLEEYTHIGNSLKLQDITSLKKMCLFHR